MLFILFLFFFFALLCALQSCTVPQVRGNNMTATSTNGNDLGSGGYTLVDRLCVCDLSLFLYPPTTIRHFFSWWFPFHINSQPLFHFQRISPVIFLCWDLPHLGHNRNRRFYGTKKPQNKQFPIFLLRLTSSKSPGVQFGCSSLPLSLFFHRTNSPTLHEDCRSTQVSRNLQKVRSRQSTNSYLLGSFDDSRWVVQR